MKRELKDIGIIPVLCSLHRFRRCPYEEGTESQSWRKLLVHVDQFQTLSLWRGNWKISFCPPLPDMEEKVSDAVPMKRELKERLWSMKRELKERVGASSESTNQFQTLSLWRGNWKSYPCPRRTQGCYVSDAVPMKRELKEHQSPSRPSLQLRFQTLSLWRGNWKIDTTYATVVTITKFQTLSLWRGNWKHCSTKTVGVDDCVSDAVPMKRELKDYNR